MKTIKLKLTSFEAKLIFTILAEKQDECIDMIPIDDDDYYNWLHGELYKINCKILDKIKFKR